MKAKPTFYRQRLLIALLEAFNGELSKLDLQKLLFLFMQKHFQKKQPYEFIPYHYGCYSFQANSDIKTLINYGFLKIDETNNMVALNREDYRGISNIKNQDIESLKSFAHRHKDLSGDDLIEYVYKNYPYYTIHSKIAHKFIDIPYKKQASLFPHSSQDFYTIGYEGITFEKYINKLIDNDITILCDVRRNAFSMKFGFSKNMLKHALENVGIKYIHLPELGIESEERQELNCLEDYKKLFEEYENTTLCTNDALVALSLLKDLSSKNKIALTCFEKDIEYCHRGVIAKKLNTIYAMESTNL